MTAYLLDTHTFIWLTENDPTLPEPLRDLIDTAETVYVSIASLWEMAINLQLGKLHHKQPYATNSSSAYLVPGLLEQHSPVVVRQGKNVCLLETVVGQSIDGDAG